MLGQESVIVFPPQKNQWCTEVCTHYLSIWEAMDSNNHTEKIIMKIHINETKNNLTALVNENETYVVGQIHYWAEDSMIPDYYHWNENGTTRLPSNKTSFDLEDSIIPLGYNNYEITKQMVCRTVERAYLSVSTNEMINKTATHQEMITTSINEVNENAFWYDDEYIIDNMYLVVKYNFEFWINSTLTNFQIHMKFQYLVEANTGIPLQENMIFESYNAGILLMWIMLSTKTVATSVALPTFSF